LVGKIGKFLIFLPLPTEKSHQAFEKWGVRWEREGGGGGGERPNMKSYLLFARLADILI